MNMVFSRRYFKLHAGNYQVDLGQRTCIMGIVNMTPDSFSGDGCVAKGASLKKAHQKAVVFAKRLVKDGADIIDVGGESSRPGARGVTVKEEIERVIPLITALARKIQIPISVDTCKPKVAQLALDAGAIIVNNIHGVHLRKDLLTMIRNYNAAIVLMHMQGNPRTMQKSFSYKDVIREIKESLGKAIENCLDIGIKMDKIIIDPGIGFGKSVAHNLKIIHSLKSFGDLNSPVLIGVSRKSFIGKVLDKEIGDRLYGTIACVCASILNGAHIVRVHDLKAVKQAVTMTDAIISGTGEQLMDRTI